MSIFLEDDLVYFGRRWRAVRIANDQKLSHRERVINRCRLELGAAGLQVIEELRLYDDDKLTKAVEEWLDERAARNVGFFDQQPDWFKALTQKERDEIRSDFERSGMVQALGKGNSRW